jgi:hypothetical protein
LSVRTIVVLFIKASVVVKSSLAIGERVPVNIPKLGNRGGKFEVPAETLKAWLMGQPFSDQVEIIFHGLALGSAEINLTSLSTLFTTNLNVHDVSQLP